MTRLLLVDAVPRMVLELRTTSDPSTGLRHEAYLIDCACGFSTQCVEADALDTVRFHQLEHDRRSQVDA